MLAIVNSQTLIFPAAANGSEDISGNEEYKEPIMEIVMAKSVKNSQQDQTHSTAYGENNAKHREDLLPS